MKPWTVVGDTPVGLLRDLVNHIQAEPAHAPVHPPEDHVIDLPPHFRILPVQIRLLWGKLMKIILSQLRHPLPRRAAEHSLHIVRVHTFLPITPHIVIVIRIILSFLRLLKPAVFIGCMVQHQIHDDTDPPLP